ncbi:ArsR/SmtB family transcription factor [Natrialbaceae archaeon GCM10025810]|uniref:ArsR/SmtB family transcription factor n=1 Tax=Halovalidus salilacus TaxID=3075124 RepID=UPI00360C5CEF
MADADTCSDTRRELIDCSPPLIVDLLSDPTARRIFVAVERPKTVGELAAELDLPQSTAYRHVGTLTEAGLLRRLNDGSRTDLPTHYVRAIDCVSVTLDDPVRITCERNGIAFYCEPDLEDDR